MNTIDPIHKVEFSEEDVRAKYIDPSLRNSNSQNPKTPILNQMV